MIKAMEVEEISEAVKLLEEFDKSLPSTEKIGNFYEATSILNEYLEYNPNSPHRKFIENRKVAHTRRLLQFLSSIDSSRVGSWLNVIGALFEAKEEITKLSATYHELISDYEKFVDEWKGSPELVRELNRIAKRK